MPLEQSITRVSVLLATRDRAVLLHDTLAGIARQRPLDVPHEVIVVDNGSVDDTPAVVAQAQAMSPVPLHSLVEPTPGKSHAMNRGVEMAGGDLIICTDDDILPDDDWLAQLVAGARRWPGYNIFGGRISLALPGEAPSWVSQLEGVALQHFAPAQAEGPIERAPFGPNFALRRSVLEHQRFLHDLGPDGSVDYAMGDETELFHRLRDGGERFIYLPAAHVAHRILPAALTRRALVERAYRAGRGAVRVSGWYARPAPRLFGAPRHLWRSAAEAALRRMALWRGPARRAQSAIDFAYFRGAIRQARLNGTASPRSP